VRASHPRPHRKLGQLATRRADLAALIDNQPKPPSPAAINQLRRDLAHILGHGTPGQRKAIIGTHVAEIQIQGTQLIPIFKIPTDETGPADPRLTPPFRTTSKLWS
jgi:site-specific DNA recombinase